MDNYQSIAHFLFVNLCAGPSDVGVVEGQVKDTDEDSSCFLVYTSTSPKDAGGSDQSAFVYVVQADSATSAFRSVVGDAPEGSNIHVYASAFEAASAKTLVAIIERLLPQLSEKVEQVFRSGIGWDEETLH